MDRRVLRAGARVAGLLAVLGTLSCADGASTGTVAAGDPRGIPTTCVVAVPFEVSPQIEVPEETPDQLATYLVEALDGAGLRVVAPEQTGVFAAAAVPGRGRELTQRLAFAADREFGCNVIALGRVDRFRERSGGASGSMQPASVAFDLDFYDAPGGRAVFRGRFDETQKALTENVLRARRYPGGGLRWLSANEFARWGVAEVVRGAPLHPRD